MDLSIVRQSARKSIREPDQQLRNVQDLWALFAAGKLTPVVGETHPMADYAAAFEALGGRRALGKVVVLP